MHECLAGKCETQLGPKVGEVPTFRAYDTDTDLPILSAYLFNGSQYLNNRFIASK
jgi:hypothetical protein